MRVARWGRVKAGFSETGIMVSDVGCGMSDVDECGSAAASLPRSSECGIDSAVLVGSSLTCTAGSGLAGSLTGSMLLCFW